MNALERNIARLDGEKKATNSQLMAATDPAEALRLHNEVTALATQLTAAEERWCALQAEVMEEE
jgi:ATP-binding cassette subfamily F protein 3